MMSVDIMMSLIFRCRHHDECEHNDGRVEPYLSTKVSHTLLTIRTVPFLGIVIHAKSQLLIG
jgi:hypothetical protein